MHICVKIRAEAKLDVKGGNRIGFSYCDASVLIIWIFNSINMFKGRIDII